MKLKLLLCVLIGAVTLSGMSLKVFAEESLPFKEVPKEVSIAAERYGREYGIALEFLEAMAFYESSFNPKAVNGGCMGLMQVNPKWHEDRINRLSLTGSNSRKLATQLNKITGVSKCACERLIRTESTYSTAMADVEAAKERNTKYLKFVATLDNRTSRECQENDGRKIKIEDAVPGRTIPPLHPFCRSVVIDVIEGLEHKVRRVRDEKTGNNILVPANMTYKEWKDKYVDTGCLDAGNDNIGDEWWNHRAFG